MFSFANDQYSTPWITVSDGHGKVLNAIVFTFTYAGDRVVGMRWRADCAWRRETGARDVGRGGQLKWKEAGGGATDNDAGGHQGKVLPSLTLVYAWDEQRALDATLAVNALFLAAMLVAGGLVAYMLTVGDRTQEYLVAMYVAVPLLCAPPPNVDGGRWGGAGNVGVWCARRRVGLAHTPPATRMLVWRVYRDPTNRCLACFGWSTLKSRTTFSH
jgi:hypothetical protein